MKMELEMGREADGKPSANISCRAFACCLLPGIKVACIISGA